ncbi:MFS transporter [Psychromicrobium lacuslunae]|uniref:Multidrug transporter n=1 Tax=Psychromicrobium lacuslunae TaxID=1618207 RepID=A0A0D4C275_9MICC|nr:MFS transporter [Psychromicrobium lacuslunae]AJT42490.1 multidrug transporter [Psychromicrobium lacuslunae]
MTESTISQDPPAASTPSSAKKTPAAGSWGDLLGPAHLAAALVLAGGVALYAMNVYVTAALLPSAIGEIGGAEYYAWVATSFLTASVVASMLVNRLLSSLGPSRAYLTAFLIFGAGALINALSPNMELFLVGRIIQGIGGGLLTGLGFAVIRTALPARLWTRAAGLVSAMWGVGNLIGPALGGLFAQFGLWRWAFGLLVAAALVLAFLSRKALPHNSESHLKHPPLPLLSLVLLTLAAAIFSVTSVLPKGIWTVLGIVAGVLLMAGFIWRERVAKATVLPKLSYLKGNSLKWIYLSLAALSAGAMTESFIPLFGQELGGMIPLLAGFLGAALSVGWTVAQLFSVNLSTDASKRVVRLAGPLVLAAGLASYGLLQQAGAGPWLVVLWAIILFVAGAGIGSAFPHFSVAAMSSTDDEDEGQKAAAGISTTQLIANAVASALAGILVSLGAPSMIDSARLMSFGIAAVALIGFGTAIASVRGSRRSQLTSAEK